jgi:hypothetical protein
MAFEFEPLKSKNRDLPTAPSKNEGGNGSFSFAPIGAPKKEPVKAVEIDTVKTTPTPVASSKDDIFNLDRPQNKAGVLGGGASLARSTVSEAWEYLQNPGEFDLGQLTIGGQNVVKSMMIAHGATLLEADRRNKELREDLMGLRGQVWQQHLDLANEKIEAGDEHPKWLRMKKTAEDQLNGIELHLQTELYKDREAGMSAIRSALTAEWLKADPELSKSTGWIPDLMRTTPQLAAQILVSAATGGVGGVTFMGGQIMGSTYMNMVQQGVPHERAFSGAMSNALLQAPLEQIGLGKAARFIPGKKSGVVGLMRNIFGSAGREGLTE